MDGDLWRDTEVPMGEAEESYVVEVRQSGDVVRETFVSSPSWTYDASAKTSDLVAGPYEIAVAQISDRYGNGPSRSIALTH